MRRAAFVLLGVILSALPACRGRQAELRTVVAYVSEDQVFSEPILKDFERDTGIRVKAVYDTEETKSTGVMNRLLAEKNNPQADVYWANEPLRAEVLKQQGLTEPYASPNAQDIPASFKDPEDHWTGFSARARVLIVRKELKKKPASLLDYADPTWKGKACIANPLFGTTTTEMAALFAVWGDERARQFMEDMKKNGIKITSSNGESADLVAAENFDFSLVDSDDAVNRLRQRKPVEMVLPDQGPDGIGTLFLPNAVLLVKGGPRPENGRKLMDYLLSRETEKKLAFADCAQVPLHPGVETPPDVPKMENIRVMSVHYSALAKKLREIQPYLKEWASD